MLRRGDICGEWRGAFLRRHVRAARGMEAGDELFGRVVVDGPVVNEIVRFRRSQPFGAGGEQ